MLDLYEVGIPPFHYCSRLPMLDLYEVGIICHKFSNGVKEISTKLRF